MTQPLKLEKKRFSPALDCIREYRQALAQFPTGVTIITCMSKIGPLGITANSFTSISIDPPLIMWCPTKTSNRYAAFMQADYFSVHVMSVQQKELSLAFSKSGQAFDNIHWSLNAQNVPLISECLACFECRRYADFDGGDHSLLLGLVEQVSVSEGVPLTFAQGRFNISEERGR
jgi:flavin reductase (DIM6/NTAB) family NADH-FMN oxidoreductase RutF